ncbi:MAG TPA: hypothetical protein VI451_18840 [Anaerolineales bacterium]|nr:hypothetical protein [Anaerolineales bacterium]
MIDYFTSDYTGKPFQFFGTAHIVTLLIACVLFAGVFYIPRITTPNSQKWLRYTLALVLIVNELAYHLWHIVYGRWTIQTMLPFHLCSVMVWLSAYMLFTCSGKIAEFIYSTPSPPPSPIPLPLGAGFRYSSYGPPYNPGVEYWATTGQQMAAKFPNAVPATIWIVGTIYGNGTYLNFPLDSKIEEVYTSYVDLNEDILTRFDEMGGQVWLQVEPGNADVEDLIHAMLADFTAWGQHFAPSPAAFQFGYPADRPWWSEFPDPPAEIGNALLDNIPNTEALFWVDFTILDVFPDK